MHSLKDNFKPSDVLFEAMLLEDPLYREFRSLGKLIAEAKLTEPEILNVFAAIEKNATGAGVNRNMLGKAVDIPGKIAKAFATVGGKIQKTGIVSGFDAAVDKLTDRIANAAGGQKGPVMTAIKKYRAFAKAHPVMQGAIYAGLIALSGLSGAGLGGAAILGGIKAFDKLLQGNKASSALWSGFTTGALAYGAGKVADYFKGGNAPAAGGPPDFDVDSPGAPYGGPPDFDTDTPVKKPTGAASSAVSNTPSQGASASPGSLPDTGSSSEKLPDTGSDSLTPDADMKGGPPDFDTDIPDFKFNADQEKWLGGADRQDPYILNRMPDNLGPKPPYTYFTDPESQTMAKQMGFPSPYARESKLNKSQRMLEAKLLESVFLSAKIIEPFVVQKLKNVEIVDKLQTLKSWQLAESRGKKIGSVKLTESGIDLILKNIELYHNHIFSLNEAPRGRVAPRSGAPSPDKLKQNIERNKGVSTSSTTPPANPPSTPSATTTPDAGPGRTDIPDELRPDMPKAKGLLGKAMSGLKKIGSNFTNKFTADKLKMNWHVKGKPTDADGLAQFLRDEGVPENIIADAFTQLNIQLGGSTPSSARASSSAAPTNSISAQAVSSPSSGSSAGSITDTNQAVEQINAITTWLKGGGKRTPALTQAIRDMWMTSGGTKIQESKKGKMK